MLLSVDFVEQRETTVGVGLHVLHRVVVANHVNVEEVLDLRKRHDGVIHIPLRAAEVGILAGEGDEVHVVLGTVLYVVSGQRDDGGGAGGVVIGPRIEHLLAEVAEMVVMRRENEAAVVPLALHLGNNVKKLVILQKLVLDIDRDGFGIFWKVGSGPNDGLAHYLFPVCLVELQQRFPCLDHASVGATLFTPNFLEILVMTVGEPEVADHEAVLVLWFCEIGEHLLGIVVVCVNIVEFVGAAHARRVLAHGEIDARGKFATIHRHFHFAWKRVNVNGERLAGNLVDACLLVFFQQVLSSLVGPAVGITATLVLCGTQFLDNPFVMRQILRL